MVDGADRDQGAGLDARREIDTVEVRQRLVYGTDAVAVDSGDPDAVEELSDTAVVVGRFSPRSTARVGDTVTVAVNTARLNFFDADTRLAIWD